VEQAPESKQPARHPFALWLLGNLRWIWPILVMAIVFAVTRSDLRRIDYRRVRDAFQGMDMTLLALAGLLTVVNFAVMGIYDVICFRGSRVRVRERWWIGTLAFAWSNFLTLGPLAGPAIRFWLYRPYGVTFSMLRQAIASIVCGYGGALLLWIAVVTVPLPAWGWPAIATRIVLALLAAFWGGLAARKLQQWRLLPDWIRGLNVHWSALFMLGILDWTLAFLAFAAILHSGGIPLDLQYLGRLYFIGQGVGVLSLIPGGLGSADAFWLASLGDVRENAVAGLLVFRLSYYLLPWFAATLLLLRRAVHGKVRWAVPARWFVSIIVLLSGTLMLISAATPTLTPRLKLLEQMVPLTVLETSHLASALFGLFLFVVARGLLKGYGNAYRTTLALLLGGAIVSVLKGLEYEQAIIFVLTAALLWTQAGLFKLPSHRGGTAIAVLAPIALAVLVFGAAGIASFTGSELSGSLWLTFGQTAEGARFVRALCVLLLVGLIVGCYLVMRIPHRYVPPAEEDIDRALALHHRFGKGTHALTAANLDKTILFLDDSGFCLYRTVGHYMSVFADPTLAPGMERYCVNVLLQRAAELDRTLVFYQISARWLPVLHDFGYSFYKLGEEAIVELERFDALSSKSQSVRNALDRLAGDGYTFQVLTQAEVARRLTELKGISDVWLRHKKAREKQYAIGFFDAVYLSKGPCAAVSDGAGRMVAFGNLLLGPNLEEFAVDLMRYTPDCPNGILDLLLVRLFQWGRQQGYRNFNLGIAPLTTAGAGRQAHMGERLANILFQHGEHWYNLKGIRRFKEKFAPRWVPRYVAYPAFWMWPQVTVNIAALIAGGWRNVIFPAERQG